MPTNPQPTQPPATTDVAGEIREAIETLSIAESHWQAISNLQGMSHAGQFAADQIYACKRATASLATAAEKVEALVAENERLRKQANHFLVQAIDKFMIDSLIAIAGAVATPEKGYIEDGGLDLLLSDIKRLRKQHDEAKQINLNACRDAADDDTAIKALFSPFGIASDHPPVEGDDGRFKSSVEVCEEAAGMMGELTKERNHLSKEMMQKCQDYVAIDELCKELTAKVAELEGAFRYFFAVGAFRYFFAVYDCLTENGKFGWRPYCIGKDVIDGMRNAMNGEPPPSVPGEVVDRSAFEGEEYERKRSAMAKEELEKTMKPRETYDQAAWLNNMANDYDED